VIDFTAFDQGDVLATPGIDWGPGCKPGPTVVHRVKNYVIFKVKGSTQWASRGESAYVRTSYVLAKLSPCHRGPLAKAASAKGDNRKRVTVTRIDEIEPGYKWRTALQGLKRKADGLAGKRA
jgi:hypothetical protein